MTKLQKIILTVMAALMLLLVFALIAVTAEPRQETVVGDFVPPAFDAAAQSGVPVEPDPAWGYNSLTLTETVSVSLCANITLENSAARVYFTSHEGNTGWMKIKLLDADGNLLGESGLLRPGEYVEFVPLSRIPDSGGLIVAKVLLYEPDTYLSLGSAAIQVMLVK